MEFRAVLRIRIRFILVSRIRFRVAKNFHKNQPKSLEYHTYFSKLLKLVFTDINIYPINNKTDHIWANIFLFFISRNGSEYLDPDPYQNKTDPQHWFTGCRNLGESVDVIVRKLQKEKEL